MKENMCMTSPLDVCQSPICKATRGRFCLPYSRMHTQGSLKQLVGHKIPPPSLAEATARSLRKEIVVPRNKTNHLQPKEPDAHIRILPIKTGASGFHFPRAASPACFGRRGSAPYAAAAAAAAASAAAAHVWRPRGAWTPPRSNRYASPRLWPTHV